MPHSFEIRSPKFEIRKKSEARNSVDFGAGEISRKFFQAYAGSGCGIRHWDFLRILGLRISDLSLKPAAELSRGVCYA